MLLAFIARGGSALAALLLSILLARVLTQVDAGVYFTGMTLTAGLAIFLRFGLDQLIIRTASDKVTAKQALARYALWVVVLYGLLILPLAMVTQLLWGHLVEPQLWMFIHCSPAAAIVWLSAGYLKSQRRPAMANIVEAGAIPALLLLVLLLNLPSLQLDFSVAAYAVVSLLMAGGSLLVLLGRGGLRAFKFPERSELRESSSIMTSGILDFCVVWFSGLVLVAFSSMAEVAGFHVAQRLVILVSLVLIVVNSVSAPIYARAFRSNDLARVSEVYRCTTVFTVVVALLPLLAYFVFPATLMGLFGSEYKSASMLLVVLAVGQLVNVLTGSVGYLLMLSGNADHYRRASLYSAAFTLIATWPLLYFMDALGAAVAASAGLALKNILAALYVRKYVGVALTLSLDDLGVFFSRRRMNEILTHRD